MGVQNVQQLEGSYTVLLYYIHNCMHTYRTAEWYRQHCCYIVLLLNDIDSTVVISCYCWMISTAQLLYRVTAEWYRQHCCYIVLLLNDIDSTVVISCYCWMISTALLLYRVTLQCLSPFKEIFSGKTTGTLCSSYRPFQGIVMIWWQHCLSVCLFVCLSVCLSPQRVLVQSVSQYQPPDRRTVLILLQSVSQSRSTKHLTPELRSYNSYPFCRIACVLFH